MLPALQTQIKAQYDDALKRAAAGQLDDAERLFCGLLKTVPHAPEVHFQLSRIAHLRGDHAARARHLAAALEAKPDEVALNDEAVKAFAAVGDQDAALAAHDRLIAAHPGDIGRQVDKALTLQFAGQFDAAEKLLRKLIRKHPDHGSLYRVLLATVKLPANDPLMRTMTRALANPRATDVSRMHLSYALAKASEDQGATGKVFAHLHRANGLQRKLAPFDRVARAAENTAYLAAQTGADLAPIGPTLPVRPIFVTGMPRSGTTLVEQIIAGHSGATAGGELAHALKLAAKFFGTPDGMTPLAGVTPERIAAFAAAYGDLVRRDTGATTGMVTDKSIQNHLIFGLLHRAMPGARFVVVHRDPRDIALSIYKNHFRTGTHRYATDLADIAFAIRMFRANVAWWKTRLPGAIHEIRYEDLVADPEGRTRALIAAVGLDWEDGCLAFHEARGAVRTLSLHQVRQPIYKASAQGWRRYETELAPFIAAWGDAPWD